MTMVNLAVIRIIQMIAWPKLITNTVHVWRAHLDHEADKIESFYSELSSSERERADRLVRLQDRQRFIISHGILRHLLASYIQMPITEIAYQLNERGKPYLRSEINQNNLQFNMSDSNAFALYAITIGREVGIDIEWQRHDIDVMGIVERFFTPVEKREFFELEKRDRFQAFYRLWACKEAYIKVIGQGLSFSLNRFDVKIMAENMNALIAVDGDKDVVSRWSLGSIDAPNGYAAALAFEKGDTNEEINYFDWGRNG